VVFTTKPERSTDRALISNETIAAVDSAFNSLAHTVIGQNARSTIICLDGLNASSAPKSSACRAAGPRCSRLCATIHSAHPRACGGPALFCSPVCWIPAYAGMSGGCFEVHG
jgi:hypothetical protein